MNMDRIPNDCPGTKSESAGKTDACAGCPNKIICESSKLYELDPEIENIKNRLSNVKHIILVLSGKGGVGKSALSAILAYGLAEDKSKNVGVMDVDICGPSLPRIFGVDGEQVHLSGSGWSPVFVDDNIAVMSIGFLLHGPYEAVIWRGPKKSGLIKQFLKDVDWGDLDYLVIDTPPGTSDEHLSVVQYLKECNLGGALIVSTPQEASLLDVRKEINFCKKVNIPILGVVENMSMFVCPKCKTVTEIFPPKTGGTQKMAEEMEIDFLGKIPLDPRIGKACDEGKSYLSEVPDSSASVFSKNIVKQIIDKIQNGETMKS